MPKLNALVVGTAGHIDHGKTTLIYALTGMETDRLKEEKQRGISIDLGFAELQLPNGPCISFVDVPGHERFVRNMLAGAAGMEAVLLIVAANESVMPQTKEHFEICRLLGIRHGIVVLTKTDLATPEQLDQARLDVQTLVAGTFLEEAAVVEVSAVTQSGILELKRQLTLIAGRETGRDRDGIVRLPIDRVFAMKGFGTVVTGTLLAGSVTVGDGLEMQPAGGAVRVRGLQAQHAAVEKGEAGQRLAVNLSGVEWQDVKRGHVLAGAGLLAASRLLDVEMRWLDGESPAKAREQFVLHIGTAECSVRIRCNEEFARLRLSEEVIALPGDRFVIRRPSPGETAGGGVVVDAFPPRRMNRLKTLARLRALKEADLPRRLELLLDESASARKLTDFIRVTGATRSQIQAACADNPAFVMSADERLVTRRWIESKRSTLLTWLREFHQANPNAAGAPLAASRMGLDAGLMALVLKDFDAVRIQGETVALAGHRAEFTIVESAALQKIESAFRAAGFQPPAAAEVIAGAGVDAKKARSLLESLVKNNRLVKLPDDLIFHAEAIASIRASLEKHKGRRFSVAEFKGWTNVSRKFAIPLLEYLDRQRVTRREGEDRIIL